MIKFDDFEISSDDTLSYEGDIFMNETNMLKIIKTIIDNNYNRFQASNIFQLKNKGKINK